MSRAQIDLKNGNIFNTLNGEKNMEY